MILVDTSAWMEWLAKSPTGERVRPMLPDASELIVPTIVQLELSKGLTRIMGEDVADRVIAFTEECKIVDLDTAIALAAAEASREHGLSTADAIIFATAKAEEATLLTCDCDFAELPGVNYIEKILH